MTGEQDGACWKVLQVLQGRKALTGSKQHSALWVAERWQPQELPGAPAHRLRQVHLRMTETAQKERDHQSRSPPSLPCTDMHVHVYADAAPCNMLLCGQNRI